jgi:hypothetical protein
MVATHSLPPLPWPARRSGLVAVVAALAALATSTGCVERRYTLRTDPPGALAIVNGEEIGTTPVSSSYTYYGDREITFIHDGYQTQTIIQPMAAPWYDNVLTEFFTENLVPYTFRDEREFSYTLAPASDPPANELQDRAEAVRALGQQQPPPRRGGLLGWLGFP